MVTPTRLALAFLALPFATLHCANEPSADASTYACLMTAGEVRTCVEDDNLTSAQAITASNRCASTSERTGVRVDSCPTEERVGSCISVAGELTQTFVYYADGGFSPEVAQKSCQSVNGVFVQ